MFWIHEEGVMRASWLMRGFKTARKMSHLNYIRNHPKLILSSQSSAKRCLNAIKTVTVLHINEWRLSLFLWHIKSAKFECRSRWKDDRLHIGALLYPYLVVPLWGITGTLRISYAGVLLLYFLSAWQSHGPNSKNATNRLPLFVLCKYPL